MYATFSDSPLRFCLQRTFWQINNFKRRELAFCFLQWHFFKSVNFPRCYIQENITKLIFSSSVFVLFSLFFSSSVWFVSSWFNRLFSCTWNSTFLSFPKHSARDTAMATAVRIPLGVQKCLVILRSAAAGHLQCPRVCTSICRLRSFVCWRWLFELVSSLTSAAVSLGYILSTVTGLPFHEVRNVICSGVFCVLKHRRNKM